MLKKTFDNISLGGKVQQKKMKQFLVKRYKEGLGIRIMKVLEPYIDLTSIQVNLEGYCRSLEKIFQSDDQELKKFAFKIFDTNNDKKLS